MRPSLSSLISATRATSRRTGSWHESVTASGVSSTIISTPVNCSKARIFRPSRPIIRPFSSSPGRFTVETVISATYSLAQRCTARLIILRAVFSASSFVCCSTSRMRRAASSRVSRSTWARIIARASSRPSCEIRSSSCTWANLSCSTSWCSCSI